MTELKLSSPPFPPPHPPLFPFLLPLWLPSASFPLCVICLFFFVEEKKKFPDTSSDPAQCFFFFSSSYMVISLQISAVSGRVLPSCLDHSALICETAESLRTAEHASLEWIYVLREAQKAEKKEILHLRNEVLHKKTPSAQDAME